MSQLPRHGASCPVGIGVSCSADRQALGKITAEGVFLEALERDVGKYLPEVDESQISPEVLYSVSILFCVYMVCSLGNSQLQFICFWI